MDSYFPFQFCLLFGFKWVEIGLRFLFLLRKIPVDIEKCARERAMELGGKKAERGKCKMYEMMTNIIRSIWQMASKCFLRIIQIIIIIYII